MHTNVDRREDLVWVKFWENITAKCVTNLMDLGCKGSQKSGTISQNFGHRLSWQV
jgi:hypothetical protein